MFDAFVHGRIFGVRGGGPLTLLALARWWSGQDGLCPTPRGCVCWDGPTRVSTEGSFWHDATPPVAVRVRHAVIPLGQAGGVDFFAFVSPLSGLPSAFGNAAARHLPDSAGAVLITGLDLHLDAFARAIWPSLPGAIRAAEREAAVAAVPGASKTALAGIERFSAVELAVGGGQARIDGGLNILVSDVSSPLEDVAAVLDAVFGLIRGHLSIGEPQAAT